jgi:hypothetical protein
MKLNNHVDMSTFSLIIGLKNGIVINLKEFIRR